MDGPRISRRSVLLAGASLVAGSAGCLRMQDASSDGSTKTATPTATPPETASPEPTTTSGAGGDGGQTSSVSSDVGVEPAPWTTTTDGDADVEAGPDSVELRVFQCSSASATTELGSDPVEIRFDYAVEAEGWWEAPWFELLEDGRVVYEAGPDGGDHSGEPVFEIEARERTHGSFSKSWTPDGDLTARFLLRPTKHCSMGDHGNTWFTVRNVSIRRP